MTIIYWSTSTYAPKCELHLYIYNSRSADTYLPILKIFGIPTEVHNDTKLYPITNWGCHSLTMHPIYGRVICSIWHPALCKPLNSLSTIIWMLFHTSYSVYALSDTVSRQKRVTILPDKIMSQQSHNFPSLSRWHIEMSDKSIEHIHYAIMCWEISTLH